MTFNLPCPKRNGTFARKTKVSKILSRIFGMLLSGIQGWLVVYIQCGKTRFPQRRRRSPAMVLSRVLAKDNLTKSLVHKAPFIIIKRPATKIQYTRMFLWGQFSKIILCYDSIAKFKSKIEKWNTMNSTIFG